jgi:hypothetical protein
MEQKKKSRGKKVYWYWEFKTRDGGCLSFEFLFLELVIARLESKSLVVRAQSLLMFLHLLDLSLENKPEETGMVRIL